MAKYNGWANYETWAVNLWLTNDEPSYNDLRAIISTEKEKSYIKADRLKDYVENLPVVDKVLGNASMSADLLGHALAQVDFREIIENNSEV